MKSTTIISCITVYLTDAFPKAFKTLNRYYQFDTYKMSSCPILQLEKSKACQVFQDQLIVGIAASQISHNRSYESQKRLFGYHLYQGVHFAEYVLISWHSSVFLAYLLRVLFLKKNLAMKRKT